MIRILIALACVIAVLWFAIRAEAVMRAFNTLMIALGIAGTLLGIAAAFAWKSIKALRRQRR